MEIALVYCCCICCGWIVCNCWTPWPLGVVTVKAIGTDATTEAGPTVLLLAAWVTTADCGSLAAAATACGNAAAVTPWGSVTVAIVWGRAATVVAAVA